MRRFATTSKCKVSAGAAGAAAAVRVAIGVLLLLLPSVAPAGSTLEDLASDDYAVRQAASVRLLTDLTLTPQGVAQMYASASSAEQRQRLLDVAQHLVVKQIVRALPVGDGSGAMGLTQRGLVAQQTPGLDQAAVLVMDRFRGFPAYEVLRRGDLILAVNGQPFAADLSAADATRVFGQAVRQTGAGNPVTLTVHRQGQRIEVTTELASYEAMIQVYGQAGVLSEAAAAQWAVFRDALRIHDPAPPALIWAPHQPAR